MTRTRSFLAGFALIGAGLASIGAGLASIGGSAMPGVRRRTPLLPSFARDPHLTGGEHHDPAHAHRRDAEAMRMDADALTDDGRRAFGR